MTLRVFDDVEDNTLSPWNAQFSSQLGVVDSGTAPSTIPEGTYALGSSVGSDADDLVGSVSFSGLLQPDQLTFQYAESSGSNGNGITLLSGGDRILCVGTSNPDPVYSDGQDLFETSDITDNYDNVVTVTITFDWANDQYDATWFDETASSQIGSVSNISWDGSRDGFDEIELTATSAGGQTLDSQDSGDHSFECCWDNFQMEHALQRPTSLSTSTNSSGNIDLSWTDNSEPSFYDENNFTIYRNTSNDFGTATVYDAVSQDVTTYEDTGATQGTVYYYWVQARGTEDGTERLYSQESTSASGEVLAEPTNVTASVNSNRSIDVTWTDNSTNNTGYEIEINRDSAGFTTPANGGSVGDVTSTTITADDDSSFSFDQYVGIDSAFDFRVRATSADGESDWVQTDFTVYTDPVAPYKPSRSRADSNTIDLSWTNGRINTRTEIEARKDTGSGYGSWTSISSQSDSAYQFDSGDSFHEEDARFQFRAYATVNTPDISLRESEKVYFDYGAQEFFVDTFEDGNADNDWDSSSFGDTDSGIATENPQIGESTDEEGSLSGAYEGTYWVRLDDDDTLTKNLGDLSGQSDVLVQIGMAVESMDDSGEDGLVEFYDGTSWQTLLDLGDEYNSHGWVEQQAVVPDSWLSTDNRIRLNSSGGFGGADHRYYDHVRVVNLLDEYTKPQFDGISNVDVFDTSTPDVRVFFDDTTRVTDSTGAQLDRREGAPNATGFSQVASSAQNQPSPLFTSGENHGEFYEYRVQNEIDQPYKGSGSDETFSSDFSAPAGSTMPLLEPTSFSVFQQDVNDANASWTDPNNGIDGYRIFEERGDDSDRWEDNLFGDTNSGVISDAFVSADNTLDYAFTLDAYTEHSVHQNGHVARSSEIASYTFDDVHTISGQLTDVSQDNENTATINGATTGVTGWKGQAYDFDGTDDSVDIPVNLFRASSDFTVSVWFKVDDFGSDHVIYAQYPGSVDGRSIIRTRDSGVLEWFLGSDSTYDNTFLQSGSISTGTWYHAVARRNGDDLELWLDGTLVDSVTQSGYTFDTTNGRFGRRQDNGGSSEFDGQIDEATGYNTALSSAQIAKLADSQSTKQTVNVELANPTLDPLDASVEDELGATWTDTVDNNNGNYYLEFKDSSSPDWLFALNGTTVLDNADSLSDWNDQPASTISTTTEQSIDGTAIEVTWDGTDVNSNSGVQYNPASSFDISGVDELQFWIWNESTLNSFDVTFWDGSNAETVQDIDAPPEGEGRLSQVAIDSLSTVDTSSLDYIEWRPQPAGTAGTFYIDALITGDFRLFDDSQPSATIQYLEDGEEYDVRVKAQNSLDTSDYSTRTPVTLLPAPTSLQSSNVDSIGANLSWTDNAETEDGFRVLREKDYAGSFGAQAQVNGDLAPNTVTYHDESAQPSTTYRYQVRTFTEHVTADTNTVTITTDGTGNVETQVPASGTYIEVDHPDGTTIRPTVVGEPSIDRTLNGRPTVSIPVIKSDRWNDDSLTRATVRVWKDGQRLPIEEISNVSQTEATTEIECVGGIELRQRVQVDYDTESGDVALNDLVVNNTNYTANVDAITGVTETDKQLSDLIDTDSEFSTNLLTDITNLPVRVQNNNVELQQSNFVFEAEDGSLTGTTLSEDTQYSGNGTNNGEGRAVSMTDDGDRIEVSFTPGYDMPADDLDIAVRSDAEGSGTPEIRVEISGSNLSGQEALVGDPNDSEDGSIFGNQNISWFDTLAQSSPSADLLEGNTYTLRFEVVTTGSDSQFFDVVTIRDTNYSYNFDNSVTTDGNGNNYLDSPELYPDALQVVTTDFPSAFNILAGEFDGQFNDTSNSQQIELSNNQGNTYDVSASNAQDASGSFNNPGGSMRARVTLSRYSTGGTSTPADGDAGQNLEQYQLFVDINDRPVITNQSFDNNLIDILVDIADQSNYVFELVWDDANDTIGFEATRPGLRTATSDPPVENFSIEKQQDSIIREARIEGASSRVREEDWTASHGSPVTLENDNIVEGSESVFDADTGDEFEVGSDYQINYATGEITALASGQLADATEYQITYRFKFFGQYDDPALDSTLDTFVQTAPGLTSDRSCQQVAVIIVDETGSPVWVADVTIPDDRFDYNLVDALTLDQLPDVDGTFEVWDYSNQPGSVTLRLGSRDSASDLFQTITSRLTSTAEQV